MKFCSKCGKEINDEAVVCVHCGCAVEDAAAPVPAAATGKFSALGIVGFILSLVSWFVALYGIVAIAGVVFSALGMKQCNAGFKGKGLAIAGLVLSIISLVFTLITVVIIGMIIGELNSLF